MYGPFLTPEIGGQSNPGIATLLSPGLYVNGPHNPHPMDRDLELRIKGHLYEIGTTNDRVLESRQGYPAAEGGYKSTLESVADVADRELVDDVAEYIKEYIEKKEMRPENNIVRKEARKMVSRAGHPPDPYLNAA